MQLLLRAIGRSAATVCSALFLPPVILPRYMVGIREPEDQMKCGERPCKMLSIDLLSPVPHGYKPPCPSIIFPYSYGSLCWNESVVIGPSLFLARANTVHVGCYRTIGETTVRLNYS